MWHLLFHLTVDVFYQDLKDWGTWMLLVLLLCLGIKPWTCSRFFYWGWGEPISVKGSYIFIEKWEKYLFDIRRREEEKRDGQSVPSLSRDLWASWGTFVRGRGCCGGEWVYARRWGQDIWTSGWTSSCLYPSFCECFVTNPPKPLTKLGYDPVPPFPFSSFG